MDDILETMIIFFFFLCFDHLFYKFYKYINIYINIMIKTMIVFSFWHAEYRYNFIRTHSTFRLSLLDRNNAKQNFQ